MRHGSDISSPSRLQARCSGSGVACTRTDIGAEQQLCIATRLSAQGPRVGRPDLRLPTQGNQPRKYRPDQGTTLAPLELRHSSRTRYRRADELERLSRRSTPRHRALVRPSAVWRSSHLHARALPRLWLEVLRPPHVLDGRTPLAEIRRPVQRSGLEHRSFWVVDHARPVARTPWARPDSSSWVERGKPDNAAERWLVLAGPELAVQAGASARPDVSSAVPAVGARLRRARWQAAGPVSISDEPNTEAIRRVSLSTSS